MSSRHRLVLSVCIILSLIFLISAVDKELTITQKTKAKGPARNSVPTQINYQGYLCTASDTSAYSGTVDMTFRIFDSESGGVVWWSEVHSNVEVDKGLFSVVLGENTAMNPKLFNGSIYWLEIEVDGEVLSPRKKLVSVGYAMKTVYSDTAQYALYGGAGATDTVDFAYEANHALYADTALYSLYQDSLNTPLFLSDSINAPVLEVENRWANPNPACAGIKVNSGSMGIAISSEWAGVWVGNTASHAYSMQSVDKCGLYVYDAGWDGVRVVSAADNGVGVTHAGKNGLFINRADSSGIKVKKAVNNGVYVDSVSYTYGGNGFTVRKAWIAFKALNPIMGMYIQNSALNGIVVNNAGGNAIEINTSDECGLKIDYPDSHAIQITNPGGEAIHINNTPKSAIYVENADIHGIQVENAGVNGIDVHGNYVGGFISNNASGVTHPALFINNNYGTSSSERIANFTADYYEKFYFLGNGNAYADGGWNTFKKNSRDEYESFSAVETAHKELIAHGKGRLSGGGTYIEFTPSFSEFVSPDIPIEITVTPVGSYSGIFIEDYDRNGFYVKSEVGDMNCEFNWMAIGRENGYEKRAEVGNIDEESRRIREIIEKRIQ